MEALRNLFMDLYARLLRFVNFSKTLKQHDQFDFPTEIVTDEIISRLPVKSILQLRSVSKPWLSRISHPSFIKLRLTRATTALFIPAVSRHTGELLMFSANYQGGSLTHLMTLERASIHDRTISYDVVTGSEHLNGLMFLTTKNFCFNYHKAIVVNPSTRKIFKFFYGASVGERVKFFFGFDESTNQHKLLRMCGFGSTSAVEITVLSRSNYQWRKIDSSFDIGLNLWYGDIINGVCVNSVIYMMLKRTDEILAFDLRTDTFSILKAHLDEMTTTRNNYMKKPYLVKINGCLGVVCFDSVEETNEMHIRILTDYKHHVWVKETIVFPESWKVLGCPVPSDSVSTDKIIFSVTDSMDVISTLIYNMKSGCFKSVSFTLDYSSLGLINSVDLNHL
ncbi:F-box protein At1g30790-like [Bidens hawaiensis]|uniref:F-box protein At1g30790-like n=1 Tax=Bidens hawaiensis TaxID=980011 RepID=UPI0040498EEA